MTMPDKIPFVLRITGTRGAIGKCYVIRYLKKKGYVMSRYPKKTSIPPTETQIKYRKLFKEASAYASWIFSDPQRKQAFLNTLPSKKRRWQPRRWMISHFLKASMAQREKIRAKMQRTMQKLKVRIANPQRSFMYQHEWQSLWQKPTKVNLLLSSAPPVPNSLIWPHRSSPSDS